MVKIDNEFNSNFHFYKEFSTVELILGSNCETRGVDAFILSYIKAEKQIRRVFTFLIFQNDSYSHLDILELRKALAYNRKIYLNGFLKGINLILTESLEDIYGDGYNEHFILLKKYEKERNKIFHGQITEIGLSRYELIEKVDHIKKWCFTIGTNLKNEIGYDGFSDSFQKANKNLKLNNLDRFDTVEKYKSFLLEEIQKRK